MRRKRFNNKSGNNGAATMISVKPPPPAPNTLAVQVTVPLAWTVLLSFSLGLVMVLAALAVRAAVDADWEWWISLAAGAVVGVLVFAWRVAVCEGDRRALLLYPLEAALGQDLDQDGYIGRPGVEGQNVKQLITVTRPASRQRHWVRGPGGKSLPADRLRTMIEGADTHGLGVRAWLDRGGARPEWESGRDVLADLGIATVRTEREAGELLVSAAEALDLLREAI